MVTDIRSNPLTGSTGEQAKQYNTLLQDYVEYRASVFKDLKALCQQAPQFVMAQIFKANLLLSMGTLSTVDDAKQCLIDAQTNASEFSHNDQLLSLIHISEPTRLRRISYAVFCLKKK